MRQLEWPRGRIVAGRVWPVGEDYERADHQGSSSLTLESWACRSVARYSRSASDTWGVRRCHCAPQNRVAFEKELLTVVRLHTVCAGPRAHYRAERVL